MKKFLILISLAILTSCGDDNSSNPAKTSLDMSSSSEDFIVSSSSLKKKSSSSVDSAETSSLKKKSSSSVKPGESSSSTKESSSSVKPGESSSSTKESSSSVKSGAYSSSTEKNSSCSKLEESSSSTNNDHSSSSIVYSSFEESSSSNYDENSSSSSIGCIYGEPIHDTRDEKDYKTVKIGNQEWMAENLNYNYKKGKTGSSRSVCFDGENANCDEYGQLYPWTVAIDSIFLDSAYGIKCGFNEKNCSLPSKWKGVCPEGWHIPTRAEWDTLTLFVEKIGKVPKMLKSTEKWVGEKEDTKGIDAVCFSAIPAGNRQSYEYYGLGNNTRFWTADFHKPDAAYRISMSSKTNDYTVAYDVTYNAYSVRCIKD